MTSTDLERLRERARRRADCEREILAWSKRMRQRPDDARLHFYRGNAFRRKGQFIAALCDFNSALRLQPTLAAAHFYKAITCAALGYRLEEIAAYRRFLHLIGDRNDRIANGVRNRLRQIELRLPA